MAVLESVRLLFIVSRVRRPTFASRPAPGRGTPGRAEKARELWRPSPWAGPRRAVSAHVAECASKIDDIVEDTEQIQQLVIARSISGRHIA